MLIQCTACGAQAKIPDNKEGAKVRCASCSHVYVARRPGAKGAKKEDPTKYFIIGGVVIVAAIVITMASNMQSEDPKPIEKEVVDLAPPTVIDEFDWDSPAVRLCRDMHTAASVQNRNKITEAIEGEAAYEDKRERDLAANREEIEDAEAANRELAADVEPGPVPEELSIPSWGELELPERNLFLADLVETMVAQDPENLVTAWVPFSGRVVSMEDGRAVAHLMVNRVAGDDGTNRTIEWRLVDRRSAGAPEARWRVAGWSRYFTPEELAAARRKKHKKTTKKTLSDGSYVIEGEIRVIAYEPDVPQAERDRIDKLIRARLDLSTRPGPRTEAHQALLAVGKPAIHPLLSAIAAALPVLATANEDVRQEEMIKLGLIHQLLTDMTGYQTTFKPDESLGATKERMESGLKQWFGWYDRKYKKYNGTPVIGDDPLFDDPDWKPRTERERIEFEKLRNERSGG